MNKQTTMNNNQHDHQYGSQIAVLRSDLDRLQGDFSKLSKEVAEDASERLHDFGERASETLHETGEELREAAERGARIAKVEFRRHPIASVIAATGAGLALGALATWAQMESKP